MIDEAKILRGLRKAVKMGWRVKTHMARVNHGSKCGCVLSVAAIGLGHFVRYYEDAATWLGLTDDERYVFVGSFDGRTTASPFAVALRSNCIDGRTGLVIP